MHVQTNGVFLSDKSDGIDSDQGRSGSTLVWQGRVLAAGWFLGRTTLDWGSPYREGIAELFSDQHPCGSTGNSIREREELGCYMVAAKPQPPEPRGTSLRLCGRRQRAGL